MSKIKPETQAPTRADFSMGGSYKLADDRQDLEIMGYWLNRPEAERWAEVERLRRMYHGEDYEATLRVHRFDLRVERRAR